jgi:hypothetical protein
VYFRRRRSWQPGSMGASRWRTVIAPAVSTIGLAVVCYLAFVNFPLMIGGSTAQAILMQAVNWGVLAAGMVLAILYRRRRPAVYRRIGRQDDETPVDEGVSR